MLHADNDEIYLGGSYSNSSSDPRWGLAFTRIGSSGISVDSKISILYFNDDNDNAGCSGNLGFQKLDKAPYINHMGYDSSKNKMFGVSTTNNHKNKDQGKDVIIFTVVLDSNGDASSAAGDLQMTKIVEGGGSEWHKENRFFAIHSSLTSEGGFDWIHTMYANEKSGGLYYMKVTPEDSSYSLFTAHRVDNTDKSFTTYSAGFTAGITGTIGSSNSYSGY